MVAWTYDLHVLASTAVHVQSVVGVLQYYRIRLQCRESVSTDSGVSASSYPILPYYSPIASLAGGCSIGLPGRGRWSSYVPRVSNILESRLLLYRY